MKQKTTKNIKFDFFGTNLFIVILTFSLKLNASETFLSQKLFASDATSNDRFGYSVAINNETIIVGSPYSNIDDLSDAGSAYIYTKSLNSWDEDKLIADMPSANDRFGWVVDIDIDIAIVSAIDDTTNGDQSGAVYVFRKSNDEWQQEQKLIASDGKPEDRFGKSISIHNDTKFIGAINHDVAKDNEGAIYVFKHDGQEWVENQKLIASDGTAGDRFGWSMSIHGDTAVIGANYDDENGSTSGSVYIFRFDGLNWTEQQKISPNDPSSAFFFGEAVSIFEDNILVGALLSYNNDNLVGLSWIFELIENKWVESKILSPNNLIRPEYFGEYLAQSQDNIIISAWVEETNNIQAGSVFLYQKYLETWVQISKLFPANLDAGDNFGWSVDIDNNIAVIGANGSNINDISNAGSVYIFEFEKDIIFRNRFD